MTSSSTRQLARREALVVLIVLAALVASLVLVRHSPASPDELKISIETLSSQFSDLVLADAQAAAPPRAERVEGFAQRR